MKRLVYCLFFVLTAVSSDCPPGFFQHNEFCYDVLPVPVTWAEALRLCGAVGARLAWITSRSEDLFLQGMLTRLHDSISTDEIWLGGTDMLLEGMWFWADTMENMTYTNWYPGEPNNDQGQHCLALFRDKGFRWDDNNCDKKLRPMCKTSFEIDVKPPVVG